MKRTNGFKLRVKVLISFAVCLLLAIPVYAVSLDEMQLKVSKMSKGDVAKEYHQYFDLDEIQKDELITRGYSEDEISKIDREDFVKIERTWKLSDEQIFYIKGTHTELENIDISNWTNADVQAYRMKIHEKRMKEKEPTKEQIVELEKRGIPLDIAYEMLRDYKKYDTLLMQSDEELNKFKEKIIEDNRKMEEFIKYKSAIKENFKKSNL